MSIGNLTDEEVADIERLKNGDQKARGEFFERYRSQLENMVRLRMDPRLKVRLSSSDIVQEVYLTYASALGTYTSEPTCPPKVWLRRLTRQVIWRASRQHLGQQCRDLRREQSKGSLSGTGIRELVASVSSSVGKKLDRQQLQKTIRRLISQMPKLEREILSLVHFEEQTIREAAIELEISYEAAKKRHRRSLERLKRAHQHNLQEYLS